MPEQEETIFLCPHCNEQITYVNYTVDAYENGTASLYRQQKRRDSYSNPITPEIPIIKTETEYFESDNSEWTGNPTYECKECGYSLELEDIIVLNKPINQKEILKPTIEPENAIESETKLVFRSNPNKKEQKDMKNMGIITCDECKFTFIKDPTAKKDYEIDDSEIIFCPKCTNEINVRENEKKVLKEAGFTT